MSEIRYCYPASHFFYCKNSNLFQSLDKAMNKVRNTLALIMSIIRSYVLDGHEVAVACLRNHGPDSSVPLQQM